MLDLVRDVYGDITLADFLDGYARRALVRHQLSMLMVDYPVLLAPSSGEPPFTLDTDITSKDRTHEPMSHQWPVDQGTADAANAGRRTILGSWLSSAS